MSEPDKELLNWCAGFFEGRGTFAVDRKGYLRAVVQTKGNELEILERIRRQFGGGIYNGYDGGRLRLILRGTHVKSLIHAISPYLTKERKKHLQTYLTGVRG